MLVDLIETSRVLSRILTVIGLWPKGRPCNHKSNIVRRFFCWYSPLILIHIPLTLTCVALMWIDVFVTENVSSYLKKNIYVLFTESGMLVKVYCFLRNSELLMHLLDHWSTHDMYKLHTPEERSMWTREQKRFKLLAHTYLICSFSSATTPILLALTRKPIIMPFPYWWPHDLEVSYSFWIAYVYELIAVPLTCLANISLDMLYCYTILHVGLCFKLVGMRLERIGHKDSKSNIDSNAEIKRVLVTNIKLHQEVQKCAGHCETIVTYPILVQVLLSSFVLCFIAYGLQTVQYKENPNAFTFMVQYAFSMTLECVLPCYYANQLTVASEELSSKLYNCGWVHMSEYNKHIVLSYMKYLRNPIILRAGNFFDIGLPLFSKIMNNAYSLLALLMNMDTNS